MRYFIYVNYLGTRYHGWQKQPNALGIQEIVEEKLAIILKQEVSIVASGRTDTGVHAHCQPVHLEVEKELDSYTFLKSLNALLPKDIKAHRLCRVKEGAHARFDAISRSYLYYISQEPNTYLLDRAWYVGLPLKLSAMQEAADYLLGEKDFEAFSKKHSDVQTYLCAVEEAKWEQNDGVLTFTIKANRFLRNMVRAIVGTLVEVGLSKRNPGDVLDILASKDRGLAAASAPAEGLFLHEVVYPLDVFEG